MAADVAQRGSSRIKSYASAFSNILIDKIRRKLRFCVSEDGKFRSMY